MAPPRAYTKSRPVHLTEGPKLARSQFDSRASIKSPLKDLGCSYFDLLPVLPFADTCTEAKTEGIRTLWRGGKEGILPGTKRKTHFVHPQLLLQGI
jgi:hypothetical protein